MQISITARHLEINTQIKDDITKKIKKLEKYFDHLIDAHIVILMEKNTYNTEATILANKITFYCKNKDFHLNSSIDKLVDKLEKQIIKHKEKISHHRTKKSIDINEKAIEESLSPRYEIIKMDKFISQPISVQEAIDQL
ncbi:MAG: ribosome-associated translation inhibitor RaiA, partial [bacterium]